MVDSKWVQVDLVGPIYVLIVLDFTSVSSVQAVRWSVCSIFLVSIGLLSLMPWSAVSASCRLDCEHRPWSKTATLKI